MVEELEALLIDKAPEVISYVLNVLAYILIILFQNKNRKTKVVMKMLFEDKVKQVEDERLATKAENEELRAENVTYAKEVATLRRALKELIEEDNDDSE